jgi:hypothetical protein
VGQGKGWLARAPGRNGEPPPPSHPRPPPDHGSTNTRLWARRTNTHEHPRTPTHPPFPTRNPAAAPPQRPAYRHTHAHAPMRPPCLKFKLAVRHAYKCTRAQAAMLGLFSSGLKQLPQGHECTQTAMHAPEGPRSSARSRSVLRVKVVNQHDGACVARNDRYSPVNSKAQGCCCISTRAQSRNWKKMGDRSALSYPSSKSKPSRSANLPTGDAGGGGGRVGWGTTGARG